MLEIGQKSILTPFLFTLAIDKAINKVIKVATTEEIGYWKLAMSGLTELYYADDSPYFYSKM